MSDRRTTGLIYRPLVTSLGLAAALAAAALLAGPAMLSAAADAPTRSAPAHPDVGDTTETCVSCHQEATPEVYRAWYAGNHGINNVKCFVCHGSLTERFSVAVSTDRCGACHGDQIESMEAFGRWTGMENANCFTCHPPHRLSPHAAASEPSDGHQGATP